MSDRSSAPEPAQSRMCSDSHRAFVSFVVSLVPPAVIGAVILLANVDAGDIDEVLVVLLLLEWNLFALLYTVLSVCTFSGVDQQTFEARMATRAYAHAEVLASSQSAG